MRGGTGKAVSSEFDFSPEWVAQQEHSFRLARGDDIVHLGDWFLAHHGVYDRRGREGAGTGCGKFYEHCAVFCILQLHFAKPIVTLRGANCF